MNGYDKGDGVNGSLVPTMHASLEHESDDNNFPNSNTAGENYPSNYNFRR